MNNRDPKHQLARSLFAILNPIEGTKREMAYAIVNNVRLIHTMYDDIERFYRYAGNLPDRSNSQGVRRDPNFSTAILSLEKLVAGCQLSVDTAAALASAGKHRSWALCTMLSAHCFRQLKRATKAGLIGRFVPFADETNIVQLQIPHRAHSPKPIRPPELLKRHLGQSDVSRSDDAVLLLEFTVDDDVRLTSVWLPDADDETPIKATLENANPVIANFLRLTSGRLLRYDSALDDREISVIHFFEFVITYWINESKGDALTEIRRNREATSRRKRVSQVVRKLVGSSLCFFVISLFGLLVHAVVQFFAEPSIILAVITCILTMIAGFFVFTWFDDCFDFLDDSLSDSPASISFLLIASGIPFVIIFAGILVLCVFETFLGPPGNNIFVRIFYLLTRSIVIGCCVVGFNYVTGIDRYQS